MSTHKITEGFLTYNFD